MNLRGILLYLRTRDSHTVFVHNWLGIPYRITRQKYETKHYFVLKAPGKEWLLTFTEVHRDHDGAADNYKTNLPHDLKGKQVLVEIETTVDHTHYGLHPEHYPKNDSLKDQGCCGD